ncbi:DUF4439 domain-containing protein [Glycomyces paridis]|uniref:DUF4439 domain-containing protein n=1 Tax=Glycomyces paridis TaxID=2126555 RepID=UPI001305448C|nr:DUF4439 domain-containing protein [Glycomyces paridis]
MTALDTGLAAEYAAIYAYGAAAVHLDGDQRDLAEELDAEHRARRDALLDFYEAHGLDAAPAAPAYEVGPVTDAEGAQQVLLAVEQDVATAWRAGLAPGDLGEREICLDMYTEAAVSLARWRIAIGVTAADPWPGRPQ